MPRIRTTEDVRSIVDRAELIEDVRAAEAEVAVGEAVSHRRAKAAVLAALRR